MSQPSISEYGIIGDCHSAALVSRDGSIDWLCWPVFDDASWFARLLDPDIGGHFSVRPTAPFESTRRYLDDTCVLRTTFTTAGGRVHVDDMMPVASYETAHREIRSDRELLRIVRCEDGEVELAIEVAPRPDYARACPKIERRGDLGIVFTHASDAMVVRSRPAVLEIHDSEAAARGTMRLRAGDTAEVAITFAREHPLILPVLGEAAHRRAAQTAEWWRGWIEQGNYTGPYRDPVIRSLLTLRLMLYAPSGGLIAAPTTSLPEIIGGSRNWDYRYCWLRDAALTVESLQELGFHDEVRAFMSWMIHTTRLSWPRLRTLYDVYGHRHVEEKELPHLAGHKASRPVRIGNGAAAQLQLDSYGELTRAAASYYLEQKQRPSRETRRRFRKLAEWVCDNWDRRDAGIWEIRGEQQHHTFSTVMCWSALDSLRRLHEACDLGLDVERLEAKAREIREAVEAKGWSDEEQSYKASFEDDRGDASLLLLSRYGYADARSDRMKGTVARIRRDLAHGALVRRYPPSTDDGMPGTEGAFGVCSFWLVSALARQGDVDEAREHFERLLEVANDLGLYAEEMALPGGELRGNFPQALTHIGVLDAALAIEAAEKARRRGEAA